MTYEFLKGVRIIEGSAFIAGPLAGLTLALHGADVIRFDPIGGGLDYERMPTAPSGRSLYWTGLNKAKRSVAVDIRSPEGREIVQSLITAPSQDGGILLSNIGASWLSHETLATRRVDVITCSIEGNPDGSTAVDYTVNCATGYPAITGGGSPSRPVNHVLPAWDVACALQAAFAIAVAASERRVTGAGAAIRLALSDVAFSTLSHLGVLTEAEVLQTERPSLGNYLYGAFGRDFGTLDGRRVMIAAITVRQWTALVTACDLSRLMGLLEQEMKLDFRREADRYEGREVIAALVQRWCGARRLDEIAGTFERHGVCWGIYRTPSNLLAEDARVSLANEMFSIIDTAGVGRHRAAASPLRFADIERRPLSPAPLLGEHTDEVLGEVLGLPSHAIAKLHDAGVVAGPGKDPTAARR
jgi:2-methylfumaryl-CoA isomerase